MRISSKVVVPPACQRKSQAMTNTSGSDSEMQRFESSRPSLRVRSLRVKSDGATLDWRGQEMSDRALPDRRKGCVRSFSEYQIDLDCFIKEIVLPDCPSPIFALAHAMGATVLLRAAHAGLHSPTCGSGFSAGSSPPAIG